MRTFRKEQLGKVRTKIVATVGPASSDPVILRQMVEAGVDVFRLNFSHGTHAEHTDRLVAIRRISEESGIQLAVLQDLCGPKIRLGDIPGDAVACDLDAVFMLADEPGPGDDPHYLTCSHPTLPGELEMGQAVLFADGTVAMEVVARERGRARLKVTLPGLIRSHQGLNVPGGALSVAALTDKDISDLEWTATHDVAYVGLSFVRRAEDVIALRQELERRGSRARIVAKIEKREALTNLDAIVAEADAVMVARGDLGVELNVTRVPAVQKRIIEACRQARVPVITATQMLNSMETSSRPTRAEASDVFNAVLDGTDAVMLSGETAIGAYPVEAVAVMSEVASEAETYLFAHEAKMGMEAGLRSSAGIPLSRWYSAQEPSQVARAGQVRPITECVVEAASLISRRLNVAMLAVATHSGRTALALSKHRNPAPTLALAHDDHTCRAMALFWGVTPLPMPDLPEREQRRAVIEEWCKARGMIAAGDRIVVLRGSEPNDPTHNEIVVREVE
jgi:pyruvate kinase